ncbi:MAG: prolyl oligopeptidase family serine peptidase [Verrucomicrobiales bacterium]|nr:prolyl oligopeptidase family serine peptidase [Verrucomicrobiales bacterium]
MSRFTAALTVSLLFTAFLPGQDALAPIPAIDRRIPPISDIFLPADERETIEKRLAGFEDKLFEISGEEYDADVAVLVKAVEYALRHNEFYSDKEFALPAKILDLADERFKERANLEPTASWLKERGLTVRGYWSSIDESAQPYGLEIPENLDLSKPVPLLVWLHGRGDKITDLHFIQRCLTRSQTLGGKVADQQDAIIVHPFGRHCVGWKHAGEIDVLEVIEAVKADYNIDPDKIALAGFSMGGAGAWHIGAHYRDQFCAVHAGAGFAETARYNRLTPETFPSEIEQTLWGVYDVPNYTRNLFNGPVLAYSGEEDKQKQAADVMAEAIAAEGGELRHIIGPGMGHKYHDDSVKEIWSWLKESWEQGRDPHPETVELQTRTLRYGKMHWLTLTGLDEHWQDTRVSASWPKEGSEITLTTKNVSSFRIDAPLDQDIGGFLLKIDGQDLQSVSPGFPVSSLSARKNAEGNWKWGTPQGLSKQPGLQGPIDDAFLSRFLVVPPDSKGGNLLLNRWVDFELDHFTHRWRELMRGEFESKESEDVDSVDAAEANLILWGDPSSNLLIAEVIEQMGNVITWTDETLQIGGRTYDPKTHVPVLIYPNPIQPERYIVINSGLTFREGHDRTNSLQNPKLPDWAVIHLGTDPDNLAPGKIVASGFFDESWK